MSDVSQTELKHKNRWIFLFVAGVGLLAFYCILMLNAKYDELSRYPYTDQKSRQLIREHLNEQEIDYIIEYSIAPNMFVAYIQEEGFNIYHASEYKRLSEYAWQEPPAHIVQMVEETIDIMSVDTLIEYLGGYRYDELHDYLVFGDRYAAGTPLLMGAQAVDTYVDEKVTLGIRKPAYLVRLDTEKIPAEREGILVDPRVNADLEALCAAAAEETGSPKACAGMVVTDGYISYDEQKTRHEADESLPYPGHSEHQLGLAVDCGIPGLLPGYFRDTVQYEWLKENAWRFGFVETWNRADEVITGVSEEAWHFRYIGTELAAQLHNEGNSFARYATAKRGE